MKIEKINVNKIKITLFKEDFKRWNIDIKDVTAESEEFKQIFMTVLKELPKETGFDTKNSRLIVEATKENEIITMTVSKIKSYDEQEEYLSEWVFCFADFTALAQGCNAVKNMFSGNSSLYKEKDSYYLVLNEKSDYANILLSEYGEAICENPCIHDKLKETSTLMIDGCAIQKITEISAYPLKNCSI